MPTKAKPFSPPENMLRIGATMGVPSVLRDLGLDPREVLLEGGFEPTLFDNPDNVISFAARGRLVAYCATAAKCDHFGLLVGAKSGLNSLGMVGLLMKYCPDVGTALNNLVRFFHLHAHGVALSLEVQGKTAILAYKIQHWNALGNNHVTDGALAVMFNLMRELCGRQWRPTEFRSTHKEPENIRPFRQFFGASPCFNAEQNALTFPRSWLTHSLPGADHEVHQLVKKQVDALATKHADNFPEQVRAILQTALLSGHSNADQVASLFSIHARTLHRRLKLYGISFQELTDETRFEMAKQMLSDSNHAVSDIAAILHYADARSFIRAFRRWSGGTPARWRASQKLQRITYK
jgi:AraC-like DNA-binding protein